MRVPLVTSGHPGRGGAAASAAAPPWRARAGVRRAAVLAVALTLGLAACGGGGSSAPDALPDVGSPSSSSSPSSFSPSPPPGASGAAAGTVPLSPLASLVRPAGSAAYDPAAAQALEAAVPQRLSIDGIGVDGAGVVPVGVKPNGELEIPGADEVGWYRFGVRPGDAGSSVLAAHIAYNGIDGVFRRLSRVKVGAEVRVGFADGTERRFRVTEVAQYPKDRLPKDVFARSGPTRVVLITCGGSFNPDLRSYNDNIVAYATPL